MRIYHILKDGQKGWSLDPDYPSYQYTGESHLYSERHECVWCASIDGSLQKSSDVVNHPEHYKTGGIETIDFIEAKLGKDGFEAYCVGNVFKYLTRYKHKNGTEDLKKAAWYLNRVIETRGDENDRKGTD